jgi:hypothetical protein
LLLFCGLRVEGDMPGSEFLEAYDGQSLADLIALEDRYRIDSLVLAFEQALQQKETRDGADALSPEERVVLAIEAFEREVNNGGYEQFFLNSSNEYTAQIADALELIGCPKVAATARGAVAALGLGADASPSAVGAAVASGGDELVEALGRFDDEFYDVADEDIAGCLFRFVKTNQARISLR